MTARPDFCLNVWVRTFLSNINPHALHTLAVANPAYISQDAGAAGSSFGVFVRSGNSAGGFASATAPIREPFLN